ncbi:MAG TPA: ABC transporter substrate-binding protein [Methanotrichaceae archaeon]|nr:ABC transporter substrate-binding protein [Methanotrichaceae archaeon]HQF17338.1 ABC transporter substrate-binding protein [Methanotrichaceae archaeon]HQI91954.1 ABC transporter substrate-binding protein [Methanotrichaceae archaeon]
MLEAVMMLTKRELANIATIWLIAALLCAGPNVASASFESESVMTVGIQTLKDFPGERFGTDPTKSNTRFEDGGICVGQHRYTHLSPLIELDGKGNVIPWLASSYSVSDTHDTLTFKLRDGVKFPDGTELNASIVKFNLDRIITNGWSVELGRQPLFANYETSAAIDERTLEVRFKKGWLELPFDFAGQRYIGYFINPLDVDPAWDINGTLRHEKRYNGLGPYYVDEDESIQKEKVVLKKRSSWYEDLDFHKPRLDKLIFKVISDPQARVIALESGDIDLIYRYWNAPLDSLPKLEKNRWITIRSAQDTMMYILATSWWKEPFNGIDGIKLREGLCYSIDREAIARGAFNGYAVPAKDSMYLSPQLPGFPECCRKGYYYDIDKARKLYQEAGWIDTDSDGVLDKNGKPLQMDIIICSSDRIHERDLALLLKSQLEKVGVSLVIHDMDLGAWIEARNKGDFDLCPTWSFSPYRSMTQSLADRFGRDNEYINAYENKERSFRDLIRTTQLADNEDDVQSYCCQICEILYADAGVIPLVYRKNYAVMNSNVKGYEFGSGEGSDRLEECWIEE